MYFYSGPVWSHPRLVEGVRQKKDEQGPPLDLPARSPSFQAPYATRCVPTNLLLLWICRHVKSRGGTAGGRLYDMLIITGRWHGTSAGALRGQHALLPRHLG